MSRRHAAPLLLAVVVGLAACPAGEARTPRSRFEAGVAGAVEETLDGSSRFGFGSIEDPTSGLTVEMEAGNGGGTLILRWPHASIVARGLYAAGSRMGMDHVRAVYVPGSALDISGSWHAERGLVEIHHASAQLLTGTFELIAADGAGGEIRIAGSFIATAVSSQSHVTYRGEPPCSHARASPVSQRLLPPWCSAPAAAATAPARAPAPAPARAPAAGTPWST